MGRNSEITSARKKPTKLPPKKPIITSRIVTARSFTKVPSAKLTRKDSQTCRGLGKSAGDTSYAFVYHCQKDTSSTALRSHAPKRPAFLYIWPPRFAPNR